LDPHERILSREGKIMQRLKQGAIAAFAAIALSGLGVGIAAAADIPAPLPPQYGVAPAP